MRFPICFCIVIAALVTGCGKDPVLAAGEINTTMLSLRTDAKKIREAGNASELKAFRREAKLDGVVLVATYAAESDGVLIQVDLEDEQTCDALVKANTRSGIQSAHLRKIKSALCTSQRSRVEWIYNLVY